MAKERVFLLPGEYHATRQSTEIATLLGSCVAVCLSHKTKPYGAMNHFLLDQCPTTDSEKGRYGDTATETILWLMQKLDPDPRAIEARIYGGARVVTHLAATADIGTRNIQIARSVLEANRIPIVDENVGGTNGRRIYFHTENNEVTVRVIQKTQEVARLQEKRADIATRATRILIVDDSPLVRKILREAIDTTDGMEVCGEAGDAFEARDLILETEPDVISLDIIMPKMDGLKFLKKMMQHYPKPIVIVSTIAKDKSDISKRAIEYGAVDVVDKDTLHLYRGLKTVQESLIPKLRHAAGRVVRKRTSS